MATTDKAARYACKALPEVVARRLLRTVRERLVFAGLHESNTNPLPGQRERIADVVMKFDNLDAPADPALIILEFQSRHRKGKLRSTLVSVAHFNDDTRPADDDGTSLVLCGLSYLTGRPPATSFRMGLTRIDGTRVGGTEHEALTWILEEDAAEALAEIEANFEQNWGLLFWVACMREAKTPQNRKKWLKLVKRLPPARQGDIGIVTRAFAELTETFREWEKTLKEIGMEESQVLRELTADAREEERILTRREDLLRLAKKKFKKKLKAEDIEMIETQDSHEVLSGWLDALFEKESYSDFHKALRE